MFVNVSEFCGLYLLIILLFYYIQATTCDPRIELERTAQTECLIRVVCDEKCEGNFEWQLKTPLGDWSNYSSVSSHRINKKALYVSGFVPDSLVTIRLKIGENFSNVLVVRMCREMVPSVENLRLVNSGPGWLNIRWTPPKEQCRAYYHYYVRYKANEEQFSDEMIFGEVSGPNAIYAFRYPHHPCDTYPKNFCVLLTDRVRSGANHTVQVSVSRFDSWVRSETKTIQAFADPKHVEKRDSEQCVRHSESFFEDSATSHSPEHVEEIIHVPWWVLVASAALISIMSTVIIIYLISRFRNRRKGIQRSPFSSRSHSVRFWRSRDDVQTSTVQEEGNEPVHS